MKYFDIDILEEKILSAGMANEEQILIPMTYDYFLYAFTTQDLPENTEISRNWLELARQKEKAIQQIVGQRSGVQFFDTFSEVVDYKKKTLLYSEEQIKKVLDETVALKTRSLALNWKIKDTGVVSLNDLEELGGEKTVHTVFAMPNQEGGFTANVTLYAGINKNTKQPLKAVSFLQMLYSEEVLSGKGIELEEKRGKQYKISARGFYLQKGTRKTNAESFETRSKTNQNDTGRSKHRSILFGMGQGT